MAKGLARSLNRGSVAAQAIVKQSLSFEDVAISVNAAGAADGAGTAVVAHFPEGNILFLGATAYVKFAGPGDSADLEDNWDGSYSMSTAPLADGEITDDAERNIIYTSGFGGADAEVTGLIRGERGGVFVFDNTDASLEINLNLIVNAAGITEDASVDISASGIVHLAYIVLGDD